MLVLTIKQYDDPMHSYVSLRYYLGNTNAENTTLKPEERFSHFHLKSTADAPTPFTFYSFQSDPEHPYVEASYRVDELDDIKLTVLRNFRAKVVKSIKETEYPALNKVINQLQNPHLKLAEKLNLLYCNNTGEYNEVSFVVHCLDSSRVLGHLHLLNTNNGTRYMITKVMEDATDLGSDTTDLRDDLGGKLIMQKNLEAGRYVPEQVFIPQFLNLQLAGRMPMLAEIGNTYILQELDATAISHHPVDEVDVGGGALHAAGLPPSAEVKVVGEAAPVDGHAGGTA